MKPVKERKSANQVEKEVFPGKLVQGDPRVLAIQSLWNACPGGSDQQG